MERGSRGDETTTGKVKSKKGTKLYAHYRDTLLTDEHRTVLIVAKSMTEHIPSAQISVFLASHSCCSTSDTSLPRSRSNQKGHRRAKTICEKSILLYYTIKKNNLVHLHAVLRTRATAITLSFNLPFTA